MPRDALAFEDLDTLPQPLTADRLDETSVFTPSGVRLGRIVGSIPDRRTGLRTHAVLAFSAFAGIGRRYRPVAWDLMSYDQQRDCYILDIDHDEVEWTPSADCVTWRGASMN